MLRPTYSDLIKALNESGEKNVESRYSVVLASAKRARQLIDGDDVLVYGMDGRKPLSTAIEEIDEGAVSIMKNGEDDSPIALEDEE